jgi:hypothetical protein
MKSRLVWSRRRYPLALVVIALTAVCVGTLVVLIDRYGPVDPTEPGWRAEVVNDLPGPVRVATSTETLPIASGSSEIFVASGPGRTELDLRVISIADHARRCLEVTLEKDRTVTTNTSDAVPC